jgi:undecaprenyl-diphosphatase
MDTLAQSFIEFSDTFWAPVLLALHSFLESSFLPGAHDIFLVAIILAKREGAFLFALFSTIGSVFGGSFAYAFGRYFGRPLVEKRVPKHVAENVEKSYQKFGYWAIAIAGFTPVPYKVFAITSGFFEIKFLPFVIISVLARGARFFLVASLIFVYGSAIKDNLLKTLNVFSIVFLALIIIVYTLYKRHKRRHVHA